MKKGIRQNLSSILFWSVISAAFIGPGTLTTAASAGSGFGFNLIWVLVLSTVSCIILQVNVTRISIERNLSLGELLVERFSRAPFIPIALGIAVVFGCAAYQAGNLLGAALGMQMIFQVETRWILALIVVLASFLLWHQSTQFIARVLGIFVAVMGFIFIVIASSIEQDMLEIITSSFTPSMPIGSEVLVMGLIGTTIVPYNLFLASGLSEGKDLSSSRIGLIISIAVGGVISIAILLTGALVHAPFNFQKLALLLDDQLGSWSVYLLGIGLFSAGFTSSLTAPLAAVLTLKGIFPKNKGFRNHTSKGYKSTWGIVMAIGLLFGFLDIKPIPAIILAQAANGIILPFVAVFLLSIIISRSVHKRSKSEIINVVLLSLVVFLVVAIGAFNLLKLVYSGSTASLLVALSIGFLVVIILHMNTLFRKRH